MFQDPNCVFVLCLLNVLGVGNGFIFSNIIRAGKIIYFFIYAGYSNLVQWPITSNIIMMRSYPNTMNSVWRSRRRFQAFFLRIKRSFLCKGKNGVTDIAVLTLTPWLSAKLTVWGRSEEFIIIHRVLVLVVCSRAESVLNTRSSSNKRMLSCQKLYLSVNPLPVSIINNKSFWWN